jgi:putative endonuclease
VTRVISLVSEIYFVYVLRSDKTGRRYIGSCHNPAIRFRQHNSGESKATKHGIPWRLVHYESLATRAEAARRESYFKTGKGRDELDRLETAESGISAGSIQPD